MTIIINMKKSYYAVKNGRVCGIYETWLECEQQIKNFSGAIFKSFSTRKEAENFINHDSKLVNNKQDINKVYIYTDGSYDVSQPEYASYGVIVVKNDKILTSFSGVVTDNYSSRNITGEVFGVIKATKWAIKHKYSTISIYHDYIGLSEWYKQTFHPKTAIAKYYVKTMQELTLQSNIDIKFIKVKSHSNDKWNEQADLLAKQALNKIYGYKFYKEKIK